MKRLTLLTLLLALGAAPAAFAGAGHGHGMKPVHGGVVVQAKELQYELVARENRLTLYAYDHGKAASLAGARASATLHGRDGKATVELAPSGEQALVAEGRFAVGVGVRVAVSVNAPGRPEARLTFRLK